MSAAVVRSGIRIKDRIHAGYKKFKQSKRSDRMLVLVGLVIVIGIIFLGALGTLLTPYSPYTMAPSTLSPPSIQHPFGTDILGRDVFSRIVYGTRISLMVAGLATFLSIGLGILSGSLSGFFGGPIDQVLSLVMDALFSFPTVILALAISFALGTGVVNTAIAVGIASAPLSYRTVRSLVLSVKEHGFIEASKAIGAGDLYIITRHVLPNTLSSLSVLASFTVAQSIVNVASLGFLGLGVQQPTPEWGADINMNQGVLSIGVWWAPIFPALMIFFFALGVNSLAEGINAMFKTEIERR